MATATAATDPPTPDSAGTLGQTRALRFPLSCDTFYTKLHFTKKRFKHDTSKIHLFDTFFRFLGSPASLRDRFGSQNWSPEHRFSVFFSKNVVFSKSCSRCGGSTILKGQTLQKSVRKATPNGNGARIDKKLLKTSLCDALWAEKVDFWSILGSGR